MKNTLLIFSLIAGTSAIAQITVNESDVVVAGDMVIQNNDTLPSVSAPTIGANQTWDYSGLVAHEEDTMNFVAPGWLANSAAFPTSNIAVESDGAEIYLEKDAAGLRTLGIVADFFGGAPIVIKSEPYETIIQFPANFNDNYTENISQRLMIDGATLGLPFDSIVNTTHSTRTVTIDSWGSMTTPFGTFEVLGQDEMNISIDSSFTYVFGIETLADSGADTTYRRSYWSNDPSAKFPVMDLELDETGDVIAATWLKESPTADLSDFEIAETMAFPNPTTDFVFVNAPAGLVREVKVYDMNGAVVATKSVIESQAAIDVRHLTPGTYILNAFDTEGNNVLSQEIVRQ